MDADAHEQTGGRATPEQMARKHVYAANGSPEFLDVVRELLQDEHYNVTTTNFVPLSFEMIEIAQPALLIIDLVLGEKVGWDLLVRLRRAASTREIPVLLMSKSPRLLEEAREKHETFGGDAYLLRPFDIDDVVNVIGSLIGTA